MSAEVNQKIYISQQCGASVYRYADEEFIFKAGNRVHKSEEVAMKLVAKYTDVPLPEVSSDDSAYFETIGILAMSYVPGSQLDTVWDGLDENTKERICVDIWNIVAKIRTIPKPPELSHLFQCAADGTPTTFDPLLNDLRNSKTFPPPEILLEDAAMISRICQRFPDMSHVFDVATDGSLVFTPTPLTDDTAVRARIYQRYLYHCGRLHAEDLPALLPRSNLSVFTHSDMAPRNIMIDEDHRITGILDWEAAGWYPDYWEYVNIWKPSVDRDWQTWMDRTAPRKWDISGSLSAEWSTEVLSSKSIVSSIVDRLDLMTQGKRLGQRDTWSPEPDARTEDDRHSTGEEGGES
ncbi:MAG: hypothetical protein M4579_004393 [Chaenotheca gracillima]|nr:MAG: hypothetical protein M4579_004393 [Chaenotheca gracillima]